MEKIFAGLAMAAIAASAQAQDPQELTFETTELRGGVVMLSTGMAGNLGLLLGADGLLLIDDQLPGTGPQVEAAIAGIAGEGVPRFILNTHYHGDHVGSNDHFHAEGSIVAAHHNIRTRLENSDEFSATGFLPILTFGEDLHFHMNGETVQAIHVPNAHTDGDAIVYFEQADVLHMGDVLFNGLFPYIDLEGGGSVDGYLAAMQRALELAGPDTQIIPGHGPMASEADIEASIAMLIEARSLVAPLVDQGLSLEEVLEANPLAPLHDDWNWGFICTPRMTLLLYNDAAGIAENWPDGFRCN